MLSNRYQALAFAITVVIVGKALMLLYRLVSGQ
jgi:hypothetical protein